VPAYTATHSFVGTVAPGGAAPAGAGGQSWSFDGHAGAVFSVANAAQPDARALAQISVAMSSVFPEIGNMFADTDEYFFRILRGMAAKVMAVMGVHVMFERPDTAITMNPIRTVLGAAEDSSAASSVEVHPGAASLYLYGTFAMEFFKDLLGLTNPVEQDLGAKIALAPDFDGEFGPLMNLMFIEMRHQKALDGVYSDAQIAALVREFNKLYEKHKSAGTQVARAAVYAIVKEINRRMSLLTSADIRRIEESITVRTGLGADRDPDATQPLNEDVDLLPDEGDRATRGLPSDSYALTTGRVTTPDAAAAERYQLRNDDVEIFNRLRRKVDSKVLSDGTELVAVNAKPDDMRAFLRDITRDIEEQSDNQKRFELVASVLRSRDYSLGSTSARTLITFHEVVGAPLTALNALLGHIKEFADQIGEHDAAAFDNDLDEIFLKTPPAGGYAANWLFGGIAYNGGGDRLQRNSVAAIVARMNQTRKGAGKPLISLNGVKFSATVFDAECAMTYPNYDRLLAAVPGFAGGIKNIFAGGANDYAFPTGNANLVAGAMVVNQTGASIVEANAPIVFNGVGLIGGLAGGAGAEGWWRPLEASTLDNRKTAKHFERLYYESLKFALLNREGLLLSLLETVAAFSGDNQGLVEVSASDQQLFINYEKLQALCSDLLQGIRAALSSFRPIVPADIVKTILGTPANSDDGSLAAAETIFKELFVKDERLPEAKSQMEIAAQILSDNFSHAVRQHNFDIELGVAIAVGVARVAAGVAGGADPLGAQADRDLIATTLAATPSRFPYRFILPALSFYPVRGPGATNPFSKTIAVPAALDGPPSALHISSTLLEQQPSNVWRLLGTVRTAQALATPVREYKNITLQRANLINNGSSIRETPFLAINQLILDALDTVYDETSEKLPRAIVQPFIEKMGGLISDEKNAFPDLIAPGVGGIGPVGIYVIANKAGRAVVANAADLVNKVPALVVSNAWPAAVGRAPLRVPTEFSTHSGVSPLAPRANLVMCASIATVLRNAYYNNDTSGKRVNVWESAEEIPEHIKERVRAHLPRTHSALGTVRAKIKFLRAILSSNMAINGRALAPGNLLNFYDALPVTCWSATYGVGSAEGLNPPVAGANFDKSYFEELFRSLDGLADTAQQAISGMLEAVGKPAVFFEEFAGSSAVATQFSGRKAQALPSALLLLTMRSLSFNEISKIGTSNFKLAYGTSPLFVGKSPDMARFPAVKHAAAQASALLPSGSQLSEGTVGNVMTSFLRATRYLTEINLVKRHLCAQSSFFRIRLDAVGANEVDIGSSPFARLMLAKYNAQGELSLLPVVTPDGTASVQALSVAPLAAAVALVPPLESVTPAGLGRQLDSAIHGLVSDFYQPDNGFSNGAVAPARYIRRNKFAQYHLPDSNEKKVRAAFPIMLAGAVGAANNSSPEVSSTVVEKILSFLLSSRADALKEVADYYHSTAPVVSDRSALWMRTFMALRIVPIQPSILSRELPFATTYNWDYAFGDMVTRLLAKYDPDGVKHWRASVMSGGRPQDNYVIGSPTEALLLSLLDPNYPGITKEAYTKFFVPMLVGDDSLPMSRPKLLSDAVHNGALLGNTFARDVWPERYHRDVNSAVVVSPQSLQPSTWISAERRVANAVETFMRELAAPTRVTGFLNGVLRLVSPTTRPMWVDANSADDQLYATYTPLHDNYPLALLQWIRENVFPKIRQSILGIFSAIVNGGDVREALKLHLVAPSVNAATSLPATFAANPADPLLTTFANEIASLICASATIGVLIQRDFRKFNLAATEAFALAAIAVSPADLLAAGPANDPDDIDIRRAPGNVVIAAANRRRWLPTSNGAPVTASKLAMHAPLDAVDGLVNPAGNNLPAHGLRMGDFAAVVGINDWGFHNAHKANAGGAAPTPIWDPSAVNVMTEIISWAEKYAVNMRPAPGAWSFNGPFALAFHVDARHRFIGNNVNVQIAAAAAVLPPRIAMNVGFGIVAPTVCDALLSDVSAPGRPNTLYYPKSADNARITRANLGEVPLGTDADAIANAAYVRTTTTLVRKITFMTNLQRMLFHFIQTGANDLGKARVIRGLVVGDQRLTDFRANEAAEYS
jgi:hypothetical protein